MKDISFLKGKIIAHRGYHNNENGIPENSMKAFGKAIDKKYVIELDVHLLKDGSVVVFHDDNLKRMTCYDKKIIDTDYEEIRKLKLLNTNEHIPLFKDVLELVNGKVPIVIELKHDSKYGALEKELMKLLEGYNGKYVIKSFSPLTVFWFKKHYPNIIRGQLTSNYKYKNMKYINRFIMDKMIFNFITKPDFISCDVRSLPNNRIKNYRKNKLILCWTLKTKEDYNIALKYCDSYICENIEEII